jgi:hypothetical protein
MVGTLGSQRLEALRLAREAVMELLKTPQLQPEVRAKMEQDLKATEAEILALREAMPTGTLPTS